MRQLTSKQKRLLDAWAIKHPEHVNTFFSIDNCPDIYDLYEKLEEINNTEILWSNVNRYISDKS